MAQQKTLEQLRAKKERAETQLAQEQRKLQRHVGAFRERNNRPLQYVKESGTGKELRIK